MPLKLTDYLIQKENSLYTLKDCIITIDMEEYVINDSMSIDEITNVIWLRNLLSIIEFDNLQFDLILDYPVELTPDKINIEEKTLMKLFFNKDEKILDVSFEVVDIKRAARYTERLMSGKEIFKDVDHLFLKLYDMYKEGGMDLVHLEILLGNCLRDSNDLSIPARLGKPLSPVLINMKEIVFRTGFVQALAFENIGKSIDLGLTYDTFNENSILEKVLLGNVQG